MHYKQQSDRSHSRRKCKYDQVHDPCFHRGPPTRSTSPSNECAQAARGLIIRLNEPRAHGSLNLWTCISRYCAEARAALIASISGRRGDDAYRSVLIAHDNPTNAPRPLNSTPHNDSRSAPHSSGIKPATVDATKIAIHVRIDLKPHVHFFSPDRGDLEFSLT